MKSKTYAALAGLGAAAIVSSGAHATYTGLSLSLYSTVNAGGGLKDVYRVYAVFTNPDDYLTGVYGSATVGPLVIKSLNTGGVAPGGNFYNPGGVPGNRAPSTPDGSVEWGTFVTIGVSLASQGSGPTSTPDLTSLTPGFPNFINGSSLTSTNMGWFTPGYEEQGRAGYAGDGDAPLRVLIMQLTVNHLDNVAGTVAVSWRDTDGSYHTETGQTWIMAPSPAGVAILGIAAATSRRRRR